MTRGFFDKLGVGTGVVNISTGTRFSKTGKTTVTWYSKDGRCEQTYSIVITSDKSLPYISLNLLELAH